MKMVKRAAWKHCNTSSMGDSKVLHTMVVVRRAWTEGITKRPLPVAVQVPEKTGGKKEPATVSTGAK
ncbi:hypothetical protein EMGBD1_00190 [Anaerolineaceae bacterium]|nr:hypothetical protein EMGBD1_00190 [Anaerolineaceae bacterium]